MFLGRRDEVVRLFFTSGCNLIPPFEFEDEHLRKSVCTCRWPLRLSPTSQVSLTMYCDLFSCASPQRTIIHPLDSFDRLEKHWGDEAMLKYWFKEKGRRYLQDQLYQLLVAVGKYLQSATCQNSSDMNSERCALSLFCDLDLKRWHCHYGRQRSVLEDQT
jgi:hypothetical protein